MTASTSRWGNCWDTALAESFVNSLKNERVHGMTYPTRADAQADVFEYMEVFYNQSLVTPRCGYSSPVQFLQNGISGHAAQLPMAAQGRPAGGRNSMGTSPPVRLHLSHPETILLKTSKPGLAGRI